MCIAKYEIIHGLLNPNLLAEFTSIFVDLEGDTNLRGKSIGTLAHRYSTIHLLIVRAPVIPQVRMVFGIIMARVTVVVWMLGPGNRLLRIRMTLRILSPSRPYHVAPLYLRGSSIFVAMLDLLMMLLILCWFCVISKCFDVTLVIGNHIGPSAVTPAHMDSVLSDPFNLMPIIQFSASIPTKMGCRRPKKWEASRSASVKMSIKHKIQLRGPLIVMSWFLG